ncbi:DUF6894 family protein [Bradyrhizobium stylosanthis]|uniref:DUF6894 domain-containing protein n=1 Tax=Bradyrhizobium stylosanthis TaxID=1803665 RepID=A0A560DFL3_9BRAD|nr:hypothetical protein [Bradyrhizobium stylosanthis]TWA95893.1 hypothetical protein FBZ96_10783 [Bradyrhizobium stylosanthis]
MQSLLSALNDAAMHSDAWPQLLRRLMDEAGVAGAALIVTNKTTGTVDEAVFCGLSAEFKSRYVEHYAALDPYSPLLDARWTMLSASLPWALLRRSEWYNEFVLSCGVRDILGTRLTDTASHSVILGVHQRIGRQFSPDVEPLIATITEPLRFAARRYLDRLNEGRPVGDPQTAPAEGSRFFFHIENGVNYPDECGSVFLSPSAVAKRGLTIARELARVGDWSGFSVVVTDAWGRMITRIPIKP